MADWKEITPEQKVEIHKTICDKMNAVYRAKNNDYGDAFRKLRDKFPNAILYRLFDKFLRLETLTTGTQQMVKDESIKDTLLDLANYCILELVEMEIDERNEQSKRVSTGRNEN